MRRLLPVLAFVVVLLVPVSGGDAAARCKKFREQSGCRLPAPAGFATKGNIFVVTVFRTATDANGRFAANCSGGDQPAMAIEVEWPIDAKLNFPGRPKVGKTYTVESRIENPPDSSGLPTTYLWTGKLKVKRAAKAELTLGYTFTKGPRTCTGEVTRTLTRVKTL